MFWYLWISCFRFAKFYIAKKSSEKQKLSADGEAEERLADKEERLADKEERLADTEERVAATEERLAAPEEGGTQEKPEGESDITFENILRVFAHEHNLKMSQADVKRQKKVCIMQLIVLKTFVCKLSMWSTTLVQCFQLLVYK